MPVGVDVELSPEKVEWVKEQIRSGRTQDSIAAELGLSAAWVRLFAKKEMPDDPIIAAKLKEPTQLQKLRLRYNEQKRVELLEKLFDKVDEMLTSGNLSPSQIQSLAVTMGILIDKTRLEAGDTTSKTEISTTDARDTIARRLAELSERRRANGDTSQSN